MALALAGACLFLLNGCADTDYRINFLFHALLGKTIYYNEPGGSELKRFPVAVENLRSYGFVILDHRTSEFDDHTLAYEVDIRFVCQVQKHRFLEVKATVHYLKDTREPWNVDFRGYEQTGLRLPGRWPTPARTPGQ